MKRLNLLFVMLLALTASAWGQTQRAVHKVQGIERADLTVPQVMNNQYSTTRINFGSIRYWVGTGNKQAALAVQWQGIDHKQHVYVWGYRWNGAKKGSDMISDIAHADPRFYLLVNGGTWSYTDSLHTDSIFTGDAIGGIGYNQSTYAQEGCSNSYLNNGCVECLAIAEAPSWQANLVGPIEYVTPPSNSGIITSNAPMKVQTRSDSEPQKHVVKTIDEFINAVEIAASGDIVEFDESLRGQVLEYPDPDTDYKAVFINNKKLTINGNGVVLYNCHDINVREESDVTIKDIVFDKPCYYGFVIGVCDSKNSFANINIDGCTFKNYIDGDYAGLISFSNRAMLNKSYHCTIQNCLFENNTLRDESMIYFDELITVQGYVDMEHDFTCSLINNTFRGNKARTASCLSTQNKIDVILVNNVFEDNVHKASNGIDINIKDKTYLTSAYNVISGTINEGYQSQLSETDKWAVDLETSLENVDGQWQVKKDSPAYHNLPANTVIEGVEFPTTDIYGNAIDYTKPTQAGCSQLVVGGDEDVPAAVDYAAGTFLLNEDWYGHRNSTINFLTQEGEMIYRVIQRENEGVQLGCTAQYGTIYGGKIYITSKQDKDPGAKVTGGRLTIADARTMKVEKQFQTISANGYKGKADGRAFLGVNEHKGYMGTSNGIFILDLDELEFTDFIKVPGDDEDLYTGQVGNMVRAGDYVFANHQNAGLLVIDPETDQILQSIKPNDALVSTMTLANDGNLWLMSGGKLVKLDPNTLEMETIELPANVKLTSEGWGAWRASTFCASRQQNALFWVSADGALEDKGDVIFKYDIDKGEVSNFIQLPEAEGWSIYGSSFRIDPVTDEAIMCLFKTYGSQDYITRKYNAQGEKILELEMEKNYWFPALPIYPDNAAPVVSPLEAQTVTLGETAEISLAGLAEDADNMTAAIVKTVKAVSDAEVLSATIKGGKLILEGLAEGTATVTIQVNSNGQLAETSVEVTVAAASASDVASFEDFALEAESYWAGDEEGEDWYYGLGYQQRFKSGGYSFVNYCIPDYQTWIGYAVSNQTSTDFSSLDDQFKSCVGSGVNGSANYCVAYPDGTMWGETLSIEVEGGAKVVPGFYITNSAYVVNSITKGDSFAGDPFTVGDYFKVTIHALDADGNETATRDFCLADYRFSSEADRYYINDWQYVDLSQLGEAAAFTFTFSGSRANAYGLTTPTYFCIDDFGAEGEETVREEGTATGINELTIGRLTIDNCIYNINGQRVTTTQKGLNIINGKKTLVK